MFRTYCASCHGAMARGDGPIAGESRRRLPDLTQYSTGNAGVFPSERLRRIIDGRDIAAHGTRDMPVRGAFSVMPGGLSSEDIEARIDAVVRYLQGISSVLLE